MVNLVEDWKVLEDYAGDKQGYYQVLASTALSRSASKLEESASRSNSATRQTRCSTVSFLSASFMDTLELARVSETKSSSNNSEAGVVGDKGWSRRV